MRWSANNKQGVPNSRVLGANMGPIWGRQDPGGPMLAPWTLLSGMFMGDFVTSSCLYVTTLACYHKLLYLCRAVKLPWIFPGTSLTFMGLPDISKVILTGMHLPTKYVIQNIQIPLWCGVLYISYFLVESLMFYLYSPGLQSGKSQGCWGNNLG